METLEIWKDHMGYHSEENKEIDLEGVSWDVYCEDRPHDDKKIPNRIETDDP